ncbi:MAG TPA: ribonuclease P protein component [Acidimicrobiales bacterium]|nr:ribonuclease P protein component [Acidimicrobiales bacterium]
MWRVRDRQTFVELRRSRQRVRRDTLVLARVPSPAGSGEPPRVAFAIGRKLGGAVARNRVRRRLRAAFTDAAAAGRVPGGAYLAVVRQPAMTASFDQLRSDVDTALLMIGQAR